MVPVSQLNLNLKTFRHEMTESIKSLEVKLQKSLHILSEEIDGLKEPLLDVVQDIDREREAMTKELERSHYANRQLVQMNCLRPNMFTETTFGAE